MTVDDALRCRAAALCAAPTLDPDEGLILVGAELPAGRRGRICQACRDRAAVGRCRAGRDCATPEDVWVGDEDEGTLVRIGTFGLLLGPDRKVCTVCTARVSQAVGSAVGDVDELSLLLVPSGGMKLRDPDMPFAHTKPSSKPPLQTNVYALRELMITELECAVWAVHPGWNIHRARRTPLDARIRKAAALLRAHVSHLLTLPEMRHRARSLSERRTDGYSPDDAWRGRTDIWIHRDGADLGLRLLDLHNRAQRFAGRHPGEFLPTPCPACSKTYALFRDEHNGRVNCQMCAEPFDDSTYESYLDQALNSEGLGGLSPLAPTAPRLDEQIPYPLLDTLGRRIAANAALDDPGPQIRDDYRAQVADDLDAGNISTIRARRAARTAEQQRQQEAARIALLLIGSGCVFIGNGYTDAGSALVGLASWVADPEPAAA